MVNFSIFSWCYRFIKASLNCSIFQKYPSQSDTRSVWYSRPWKFGVSSTRFWIAGSQGRSYSSKISEYFQSVIKIFENSLKLLNVTWTYLGIICTLLPYFPAGDHPRQVQRRSEWVKSAISDLLPFGFVGLNGAAQFWQWLYNGHPLKTNRVFNLLIWTYHSLLKIEIEKKHLSKVPKTDFQLSLPLLYGLKAHQVSFSTFLSDKIRKFPDF